MAVLSALISAASAATAFAGACPQPTWKDVSLFSADSAEIYRSDVQGLTVSAGRIIAEDFCFATFPHLCSSPRESAASLETEPKQTPGCGLTLAAARSITLSDGQVAGGIESSGSFDLVNGVVQKNAKVMGDTTLIDAKILGTFISDHEPHLENAEISKRDRITRPMTVDFGRMGYEIADLSTKLAKLPNTASARWRHDYVVPADEMLLVSPRNRPIAAAKNTELTIQLPKTATGTSAIRLQAADLVRVGRFVLKGTNRKDQRLVINIVGREVFLQEFDVVLVGGLAPRDIVWNLPEARTLLITNTHNALYGLPGRVFAPDARAQFYEGLLTGSLFVESLIFDRDNHAGLSSGQINVFEQKPGTKPGE